MSGITDALFKKTKERPMSPKCKMVYTGLLLAAMVFLLTAYFDTNHAVIHQVGTTVCLSAAVLIAAGSEIKKTGIKKYIISGLFRDLGILLMWGILLAMWIMFPEAGLEIKAIFIQ